MRDGEPNPELERAEPLTQEVREEIAGHVHRLLGEDPHGSFTIHDSRLTLLSTENNTLIVAIEGEIAPEEIRDKDFTLPPEAAKAFWYPIEGDVNSFRDRLQRFWRRHAPRTGYGDTHRVNLPMGQEIRDYLELFRR